MDRIVDIQLKHLRKLLADRKMSLELSETARKHLAQVGYDPAFGARPLKRAIQQELQDPLSLAILEGKYHEGSVVKVDAKGDAKRHTHTAKKIKNKHPPASEFCMCISMSANATSGLGLRGSKSADSWYNAMALFQSCSFDR